MASACKLNTTVLRNEEGCRSLMQMCSEPVDPMINCLEMQSDYVIAAVLLGGNGVGKSVCSGDCGHFPGQLQQHSDTFSAEATAEQQIFDTECPLHGSLAQQQQAAGCTLKSPMMLAAALVAPP